MPYCIIIKKNGDLEEKNTKKIDKKYKLCNYKNDKDFKLLHTFKKLKKYNKKSIEIYGKDVGRANSENKYEMPQPIDNELYFGSLLMLGFDNNTNEYIDLKIIDWNKIYDDLMGGFEDIGNLIIDSNGDCVDEEERSIDSEQYDDNEYTNEGYYKDGFIVDDEELEEEDYVTEDELTEEEEEEE